MNRACSDCSWNDVCPGPESVERAYFACCVRPEPKSTRAAYQAVAKPLRLKPGLRMRLAAVVGALLLGAALWVLMGAIYVCWGGR